MIDALLSNELVNLITTHYTTTQDETLFHSERCAIC